MQTFSFQLRTRVIFGVGAADQVGERLSELTTVRHAVLVTDRAVSRHGWPGRIVAECEKVGFRVQVYDSVEESSSFTTVAEVAQLCRQSGAGAVVAVGGGSVIDTAKAAAIAATNDGDLQGICRSGRLTQPKLPVVALPSTAGTGAEVTEVAVIADRTRKARVGLRAPFVAPDVALVDPRLTVSAPASVTAQSGLDALTHAVESFINRASWYATEALAGDAACLIFWNLERALRDGSDMEARSALMAGSLLAAMAFANNRLALAHALSGPLCGYLDVSHGLANAILLPPTLRFVLPEAVGRLSALGQRLGVVSGVSRASAEETVRCIESLAVKAGIPKSFAELGLTYDEEVALKICSEALRSPNVGLAPRAATLEDLMRIYRCAFSGSGGGGVCDF